MNLIGPITGNEELDAYLFHIKRSIEDLIYLEDMRRTNGYSGTFTVGTKTITVEEGIITKVV